MSSRRATSRERTAAELVAYYAELKKNFPIISIEDGCAENDWDGWKHHHQGTRRYHPARG